MTWWHQLVEVLIGALANSALYAVMSIGMSLAYGVTKVFNFAYGSFYSWGGYFGWLLFGFVGSTVFGYPLVFLIVFIIMFFVGFLAERGIARPLRYKPRWDITIMMATLGLAIFLDNLLLVTFGPYRKSLPLYMKGTERVGGFVIGNHEILIFLIAIAFIVGLNYFLTKSRLGMAMRAVSQDPVGAHIVGIRVNRVYGYAIGLSSSFVGMSALLLAPKIFLSPTGGWPILIKAFIITALGGLGSVKGTLMAAFILAFVEALVGLYVGMTWVKISWFFLLMLIFIFKPKGLLAT